MLRHVIEALNGSGLLERVAVVSPDEEVLRQASAWGAVSLLEAAPGHNPALHAAALQELAGGATALLTISADLPLLQPRDVQALFARLAHVPVVLAPSHDGSGTNALLLRPPLALPYLFGPNSLQRYLEAAAEKRLEHALYQSVGTALDIDTPADLHLLERHRRQTQAHLAS
jgi:2-phospho-L-lactate guanylyltransferase